MIGIKKNSLKEIDQLVERLTEVFNNLDVPIVSSKNTDNKKIALAAGSLHMVFQYDKERGKFRHREHRWENPIEFKQ